MATGAYDPYQVMMKTREPVQGPDVAGASTTIANLGNYLNKIEASNREADLARTELMIEESRQASQDMFKIQELASARRQQDFENTLTLMKMASQAKRDELELKARNLQIQTSELAFNDQLSRIQSRTAYQQFAPLMIKAMTDNDVVKYNELFSQVTAIPGVFDHKRCKRLIS